MFLISYVRRERIAVRLRLRGPLGSGLVGPGPCRVRVDSLLSRYSVSVSVGVVSLSRLADIKR